MPSPVFPAARIPYDADGSAGLFYVTNTGRPDYNRLLELTPPRLAALNGSGEAGLLITGANGDTAARYLLPFRDATVYLPGFLAVMFPQTMDIESWYCTANALIPNGSSSYTLTAVGVELQSSRDSTNGLDGTWKTVGRKFSTDDDIATTGAGSYPTMSYDTSSEFADGTPSGSGLPGAASNERSLYDPDMARFKNRDEFGLGVRDIQNPASRRSTGVRLLFSEPVGSMLNLIVALHLYGKPSFSEEKIRIQDPITLEDFSAEQFSWGDIPAGTEKIRELLVTNASSTKSAQVSVRLGGDVPASTPTSQSALQLSPDGTVWGPQADLAILAPGESASVFAKLSPPASLIGLRFAKIRAEVDWT